MDVEELEASDVDEPTEEEISEIVRTKILIHALIRALSFQTMRVKGLVGKRDLHILIDTGSIHNFLNDVTAADLKCTSLPMSPVQVTIANGSTLTCQAQCKSFR